MLRDRVQCLPIACCLFGLSYSWSTPTGRLLDAKSVTQLALLTFIYKFSEEDQDQGKTFGVEVVMTFQSGKKQYHAINAGILL